MALDRVVGQVDGQVLHRLGLRGVRVTREAHVAFPKQVAIELVGHQNPATDIKLPFLNQKRPLDVLLDHEAVSLRLLCLLCWIVVGVDEAFQLLKTVEDVHSSASVKVVRLQNPHILARPHALLELVAFQRSLALHRAQIVVLLQ